MSCSQCVVAALLVALVVGVQGYQIIYVDTENGTLNTSCWEGGLDHPCGSLKLAATGAQRYNSTIAIVVRYGISRNTPTTALTTPQALFSLPLPTINNGTCRCGPTASRWNESATIHKYSPVSAKSNVSCPPWFDPFNGTCKCGDRIDGVVRCNETLQESAVLDCYGMTYSKKMGTVVGACLYNCVRRDNRYHRMPKTVEELNDAVCGHLNRGGQLCGECKTNYSPPVYSYDLHCTMCSGDLYNWIKYVAIAFAPLTIFLVLVLCCRISATSPQLYAFVTYSQALSYPANVRLVLFLVNKKSYPCGSIVVRILLAIYGFWNLDFFRTLIPHKICLKVNTLQALALEYGIAFYPLALIIVTYVLIELHAHNFRVIVWTWRPFHRCFARFRQKWDIKTSTVDAFATFLILSNVRLLSVSFDLLILARVYSTNGSVVGLYLYYDASIEYFGNKHLPYAIVALLVVLIFIIFPILLLLLYPMRCCQKCLVCCRVKCHALPIFIDAFQGYYKDGTNGTRDCRYFAGVYLLVRLILIFLFAVTDRVTFNAMAPLVLMGVAMLLAIVQPYKAEFSIYNAVDSVFVLTLVMWYVITLVSKNSLKIPVIVVTVSGLLAVLPLLYLVVIFGHWICSRTGAGQRLVQGFKSQMGRVCRRAHGTRLEESLPDRIFNRHLCHDDGDCPMSTNSEKFSNQAYSRVKNEESTML